MGNKKEAGRAILRINTVTSLQKIQDKMERIRYTLNLLGAIGMIEVVIGGEVTVEEVGVLREEVHIPLCLLHHHRRRRHLLREIVEHYQVMHHMIGDQIKCIIVGIQLLLPIEVEGEIATTTIEEVIVGTKEIEIHRTEDHQIKRTTIGGQPLVLIAGVVAIVTAMRGEAAVGTKETTEEIVMIILDEAIEGMGAVEIIEEIDLTKYQDLLQV